MTERSETVVEVTPNAGFKTLLITLPVTTLSGDTAIVELQSFGATKLQWIGGVVQSVSGSVVALEPPLTSVSSSGLMTLTVGSNVVSGNSVTLLPTVNNSIRTYLALVN